MQMEEAMRIGLLIKDTEYRDALVKKLSSNDNDLFVNILDGTNQNTGECLILTDASPESLDKDTFERIKDRTVFICNSNVHTTPTNNQKTSTKSDSYLSKENGVSCNRVFKYSSVNEIISDISLVYDEWRGSGLKKIHTTRTIAVLSDSDLYSADRCKSLARQIIYRHGGRVLVFSLSYLNDYGSSESRGINRFARIMYEARMGRLSNLERHAYTDTYGVSYLLLPPGQNPAAYLELEELSMLITGLAAGYDTVILDMATCFRKENILLLKSTDCIAFFESGRRHVGLAEIIGKENAAKVREIKLSGDSDEAMDLDDYVREIYGIATDEYKS